MPADHVTMLDLLRAYRRRLLRKLDGADRAIAAAECDPDSSLSPVGCDRRVDGIICSPSIFPHVCECGATFTLCARHGGDQRAREDLAKHRWLAHRVDDREGGSE